MKRRLRILHLEDEPDFAELVSTMLVQDGVEADILRAGNRKEYQEALEKRGFDLILSDYHLPSFTGLEALAMAQKRCPEIPFILISGTIGEAAAIASLKAGATDYLLKQKPERLASAVRRAVEEAIERVKLRNAEAELVRREKYFRTLTENSLDVLSIVNREGVITYMSPSVEHTLGWKPEELVGHNSFAFVYSEDLPRVKEAFQSLLNYPERAVRMEYRMEHKNGSMLRIESFVRNEFRDPDIAGMVAHSRDVTDRWRAEEELRNSEMQYRLLFQENPNPMWVFDIESLEILEVNEAAVQYYGYSREEFLKLTLADLRVPEKDEDDGKKLELHKRNARGQLWRHRRKGGDVIDVEVVWSPMAFQKRFAALAMATDVTERRRVEHRDSVFLKLSHNLSMATSAAAAAQVISEAADALFEWDNFGLDLYSAETGEFVSLLDVTMAEGEYAKNTARPERKKADALLRRVLEKGPELICGGGSTGDFASRMFVPMRRGTEVIGMLSVQSRRNGAYTKRDLEMLEMLASECSGALERVRVEEQLHESQRRFRDIFENSPDAIFVEDLKGNVLDVNLAASLLHGAPREQLIGKNAIEDLVPAKHREEAQLDFERLASGKTSRIESESITSGGRVNTRRNQGQRSRIWGKTGFVAARARYDRTAGGANGPAKFGNTVSFRLGKFRRWNAFDG